MMDQDDISLTDREFERVKQRVYRVAGISLSDAKRTLVVSRLFKVVRTLGLASFEAYIDYLERQGTEKDAQDFVNALTTNLTRFYREDHHFEHLLQHVQTVTASRPRMSSGGRPRLRIWSAGCSTGQEPYTIALCLGLQDPGHGHRHQRHRQGGAGHLSGSRARRAVGRAGGGVRAAARRHHPHPAGGARAGLVHAAQSHRILAGQGAV
jgi:hypothetical protein